MSALSIVIFAAAVASPGPLPAPNAPSAVPSMSPGPLPASPGASAAPGASAQPATPVPVGSPPSGTAAPVPSPTTSPTPASTPSTSATPLGPAVTASPAPSATSSLAPTPLPYTYRFVPRQPERLTAGQPQILAVFLNDRKLRSRGPINIKVETNADVVKVVSRSNGREGSIPRTGPGEFEATSVLPKIPFIAAGMTVDLEFIATSADGRKATVRVPVRLD